MRAKQRRWGEMHWPPRDAAEMRAWQAALGSDLEIARALGLSRASVHARRRRHGLAAVPGAHGRGRVRERRPRALVAARVMARLYAGRRYEDRIIRPLGEGVAVRVDAPRTALRSAATRRAAAGGL